MGLWDTIYDLIRDYRRATRGGTKKIDLAKDITRRAYLRFNFEWDTEVKSEHIIGRYEAQKEILRQYSQWFLDIAVELHDTLPEESNRRKESAIRMKRGGYGIVTHYTNDVTPIGDACASLRSSTSMNWIRIFRYHRTPQSDGSSDVSWGAFLKMPGGVVPPEDWEDVIPT